MAAFRIQGPRPPGFEPAEPASPVLPTTPLTVAQRLAQLGVELTSPRIAVAGPVTLPTPYGWTTQGRELLGVPRAIYEAYHAGPTILSTPLTFAWEFPARTRLAHMTPTQAGRYALGVLQGLETARSLPALLSNRPVALLDIETLGEMRARQAIVTEVALSLYQAPTVQALSAAMASGAPAQELALLIRPTDRQLAYLQSILDKAASGQALKRSERVMLAQLVRYAGATIQAASPSLVQVQLQQESVRRMQALLRSAAFPAVSDIQLAREGLKVLLSHGVSLTQAAGSLESLLKSNPILAGLNVRLFDLPILTRAFRGTAVAEALSRAPVLDILELADLAGVETTHAILLRARGVRRADILRHLARLPGTPFAQESLLYSLDPSARVFHTAGMDVRSTARIAGALLPTYQRLAQQAFTPLGLWADVTGQIRHGTRPVSSATRTLLASLPRPPSRVFVPRAVLGHRFSFVVEESTGRLMYQRPGQPIALLSREYVYEVTGPFVVPGKRGPRAVAIAFRSPELRRVSFMFEPVDPRLVRAAGAQQAVEEAARRLSAYIATTGIVPAAPSFPPEAWAGLLRESLEDRAQRAYRRIFEIDSSRTSGVRLLEALAEAQRILRRSGGDIRKAWARLDEAVQAGLLTHATAIDALTLLSQPSRLRSELPFLQRALRTFRRVLPNEPALQTLALRRFHRLLQGIFGEPSETVRSLRAGERQVLLDIAGRPQWVPLTSPAQFVSRLEAAMEEALAPNLSELERASSYRTLMEQAIQRLGGRAVTAGGVTYQALTQEELRLLRQAAASAQDASAAWRNQAQMLYRILSRRLAQPGPVVEYGGITAPVGVHLLASSGQVSTLYMGPRTLRPGLSPGAAARQIRRWIQEAADFARSVAAPAEDPLVRRALELVDKIQEGKLARHALRLVAGGAAATPPPISALAWTIQEQTGPRHFLTLYHESRAGQVLQAIEQQTIPTLAGAVTLEIPTIRLLAEVPVAPGVTLPVRAIRYGGQERILPQAFVLPAKKGQRAVHGLAVRTADELLEEALERELVPLVRTLMAGGADPTAMAGRIRRRFGEIVERLAGTDQEFLNPFERGKLLAGRGTLAAARRALTVDFARALEEQARAIGGVPPQNRIEAARQLVDIIPDVLEGTPGYEQLGGLVRRFGLYGLKDDELTHGKLGVFDPRLLVPFGAHYSPTHPNVLQFLAHYRFRPEEILPRLRAKGIAAFPSAVMATQEFLEWEQRIGRGLMGPVSIPGAAMSAQTTLARVERLAATSPNRVLWRRLLSQGIVPAPYQSAILVARELIGELPGQMEKRWAIPLNVSGVRLHPLIEQWLATPESRRQPLHIPRGKLGWIYTIGGQPRLTVPDRDIILHQAVRDPTKDQLILVASALHPIEPGAKILYGTAKGTALAILPGEAIEELAGFRGARVIFAPKARDVGNLAWGMLQSFFGESISPYLEELARSPTTIHQEQRVRRELAQLFQQRFGIPLSIRRTTMGTESFYRFVVPGMQEGALPQLVGTGELDPLAKVWAFIQEASQRFNVELPPGLLAAERGRAEVQRVLLPLVRAQVQEATHFRPAIGQRLLKGWRLTPRELTGLASWQSLYGGPTQRLMEYLVELAGMSAGGARITYRGTQAAIAALQAIAAGKRPAGRIVDAAELGRLPRLVQRTGAFQPEALRTTIVGPRPGGELRVGPGGLWYLRLPERLSEGGRGPSGVRFTFPGPGAQPELPYLPVPYIPMPPSGTGEGVYGSDLHRALMRVQSASERILKVQEVADQLTDEQYVRAARSANRRMSEAIAEYLRVLRAGAMSKPGAGGFVARTLGSFFAPASGYFIAAPLVPRLSMLRAAARDMGMAEQVMGQALIHPEAFARMLLGTTEPGMAMRDLEDLIAGRLDPSVYGLRARDVAVLKEALKRARRGEYHAIVARNPFVAGSSAAVVRLRLAQTQQELDLLNMRTLAIDPITAALMYADFDQDQLALLLPHSPKVNWTRERFTALQAELGQMRQAQIRKNYTLVTRVLTELAKEHGDVMGAIRGGKLAARLFEEQMRLLQDPAEQLRAILTTRLIKDATTGPLYNTMQRVLAGAWSLFGPAEGEPAAVQALRSDLLDLLHGLSHLAQEELSIKAGKHGGRELEGVQAVIRAIRSAQPGAIPHEAAEYLGKFIKGRPDYLERFQRLIPSLQAMDEQARRALFERVRSGLLQESDKALIDRISMELAGEMLGAASLTRQMLDELGFASWLSSAEARRGLTRQEARTLEEAARALSFGTYEVVTMDSLLAASRLSPRLASRMRERLARLREQAGQKLYGILNEGMRPGTPMEVLAKAGRVLGQPHAGLEGVAQQAQARAAAQTVRQRIGSAIQRGLGTRGWMAAAGVAAALGALGYITYRRSHEPLEIAGVPEAPMLASPTVRVMPQDPRTGGIDVRILARRTRDVPARRIGDGVAQAISSSARIPVDVQITERYDDDRIDEARLQQEIARMIRLGV